MAEVKELLQKLNNRINKLEKEREQSTTYMVLQHHLVELIEDMEGTEEIEEEACLEVEVTPQI